jgi:hypothetical protein
MFFAMQKMGLIIPQEEITAMLEIHAEDKQSINFPEFRKIFLAETY